MTLTSPTFLLLFVPLAVGGPCPPNYSQGSDGGDCYQVKTYYDYFATQFFPKTYDEVELDCNADGGGLLTSIRSVEEEQVINSFYCGQTYTNIGLKCKGKDCKWDDGTPMTYTNFNGNGPSDDDKLRCYSMRDGWVERGCGKQESDCWVCRVKAKTIDCSADETEYKGGCVSVHSSPLDQKTAEASCPGGGHLVSIHSSKENDRYKQIALNVGLNGTVYIGGQYSRAVFEWTDNSYALYNNWANWFPNLVLGMCTQMLLASEFGVQGQWTSIDCTANQPYMCYRDGYDPNAPPTPKADPQCPPVQYFNGSSTIYSPNYPLSIPGQQSCEYVIETEKGTRPGAVFRLYDCEAGTTLSLFEGLDSTVPFITFTSTPPNHNLAYYPTHNVMRMVFSTSGSSTPVGTGWKAEISVLCCG